MTTERPTPDGRRATPTEPRRDGRRGRSRRTATTGSTWRARWPGPPRGATPGGAPQAKQPRPAGADGPGLRRAPRRPRPAAARHRRWAGWSPTTAGSSTSGCTASSAGGPSWSATRSPSTARPSRSPTAGWWCAPTRPPGPPSCKLLAPTVVRRLNEELGHGTVTVIEVLGPAPAELEEGPRCRSATAAVRATPTAEPAADLGVRPRGRRPAVRPAAGLHGPAEGTFPRTTPIGASVQRPGPQAI